MTLTNSRALVGLQSKFTPTNTNVSGSIQIGASNESVSFNDSNAIYSLQAFFGSATSTFTLNQSTGVTSGATTWVAGTAQVETATASGTANTSGYVSVTVTAAGMTGSPKTISIPVLGGESTLQWVPKVRAALAADEDISALFTVSGETDLIVLTRKPIKTIIGSNKSVPIFAPNDSTLYFQISGSIPVTIGSVNTTAGVASSGTLIFDGDGKDIEGNTIGTLTTVDAALFKAIDCGVNLDNSTNLIYSIGTDGILFGSQFIADNDIVIEADAPGAVQITILGTI